MSKASSAEKAAAKRVRSQPIILVEAGLPRSNLKQDLPAELIFLSEYRQKS